MTPAQRRLARHALGLPNQYRRSYRNRYFGSANHPDWLAMVAASEAQSAPPDPGWISTQTCFWMTLKGAEAALERGETLDPEEFPEAAQKTAKTSSRHTRQEA